MVKFRIERETPIGCAIFTILVWILAIVGEIRCIVKAVQCDWKEPYKAEIIYTVSACSGLGTVVGWINIEDN